MISRPSGRRSKRSTPGLQDKEHLLIKVYQRDMKKNLNMEYREMLEQEQMMLN